MSYVRALLHATLTHKISVINFNKLRSNKLETLTKSWCEKHFRKSARKLLTNFHFPKVNTKGRGDSTLLSTIKADSIHHENRASTNVKTSSEVRFVEKMELEKMKNSLRAWSQVLQHNHLLFSYQIGYLQAKLWLNFPPQDISHAELSRNIPKPHSVYPTLLKWFSFTIKC